MSESKPTDSLNLTVTSIDLDDDLVCFSNGDCRAIETWIDEEGEHWDEPIDDPAAIRVRSPIYPDVIIQIGFNETEKTTFH